MAEAPHDKEIAIEAAQPMWEDAIRVAAFVAFHPAAVIFYRPASEALLAEAEVQSGAWVLDVGTGTGIPALFATSVVGQKGRVVGVDPSASLLAAAEANAQAARATNLSFQRAAAEALPFPDASFDAVVSQLGIMFAADLPRALGEIRRVLRPGGRAAFLAWGPSAQNPFRAVFDDLVARYREEAGPTRVQEAGADEMTDEVASEPDPRHPYRFAEPGSLATALRAAGFADVREETRRIGLPLPDPAPIVQFWWDAARPDELPAEPRRQALWDEALAAYWAFATEDGVEVPAVFVLASGAVP